MGDFQAHLDQRPHLKKACLVISIMALGLAMLWARAFYGSMQAYHEGEVHLKAHRYVKAITFFDRSLHWFAPFNPYVLRSAQRLWEIGGQAEKNDDIRLALIAFRTIRGGFLAARSFYTPGKAWIRRCDVRIRKLTRLDQANRGSSVSPRGPENDIGPHEKAKDLSTFWSIILEMGFLGWLGSCLGLIMFACRGNRKAKILASPALGWAVLALMSFALWIIGMVKA